MPNMLGIKNAALVGGMAYNNHEHNFK